MDLFNAVLDALARALLKAVDGSLKATIDVLGVKVTVAPPFSHDSVDERLQKIETARESLAEAIVAVDALKSAAEENKRDLERLNVAIEQAESQKQSLSTELSTLKEIAAIDGDALRRALGLPTRLDVWRDRIVAFLLGVAASVVAAFLWEWLIKPLFNLPK